MHAIASGQIPEHLNMARMLFGVFLVVLLATTCTAVVFFSPWLGRKLNEQSQLDEE